MATEPPLPPNPDEAFSPTPLGPPPGMPGDEALPEVIPLRRRDHPILAWMVIIAVVGLSVAGSIARPSEKKAARGVPAELPAQVKDHTSAIEDIEYRYLVGANELLKTTGQDIFTQVEDLERGPPAKQLRFVILAGELRGPARALQALDAIAPPPDDPQLARAHAILRQLYRAYAQGDFSQTEVTEEDRTLLHNEFGWLGELALHPAGGSDVAGRQALLDAARRTVLGVVGMIGVLLVGGIVGLIILGVVLTRAMSGQLVSAIRPPIVNGGLYAETFAAWLILFIGLSVAAVLLPIPDEHRLLAMGGASLLGLGALAWPVARGVPWAQVRREVGWTAGDNPAREFLLGFVCYLMGLPLMAIGVMLTLLLMRVQGAVTGGDVPAPTHPIAESLNKANLGVILLIASVIAPLVEETMFRGVLYRHIREATWGWRTRVSIVVSATVVSFIFAVIHPQGILAVPALMALAYAFTLAREWRGTLLPCMVAHGTSNAIVLLVAFVLFG